MSELASAEAVFGSASRGDDDALSDRDILIVDTDIDLLNRRQAALESLGWSVASYTFMKLNALVRKGALFVQHLKDEAVILRDVSGRLRLILDEFLPKASYYHDLVENSHLAGLISIRPDTRAGALWAADILYVATRNFGILHLAQKGRFVFAYSQILEALVEGGVISENSLPHLLKLRLAKSIYRSGDRIAVDVAADIVLSAIKALPERSFPKKSAAISPAEILSGTVVLSQGRTAYHRLRNLERAYLALLALNPTDVASESLVTIQKWIENPRVYASLAASREHDIIARMKCIASADNPKVATFSNRCLKEA